MFKVGDTVSYGTSGVCRIDSEMERKVKNQVKKYLVLKPIFQPNATVYVPTDNDTLTARLKNVLTADEAEELITHIPDYEVPWITNDSERTKTFKEIILCGDRKRLLKMLKCLYIHKKKQLTNGRKIHASDEHLMHDAENLLFGELAFALNIKPEEVPEYIDNKIAG